jgi:periplasmic nitrate reductase NapD
MNIAGVIVYAQPGRAESVKRQLTSLQGVEVHGAGVDGRLVVTVEEETDRGIVETLTGLYDVDGVLSTAMVYHYFEDEAQGYERGGLRT